MRVTVLGAGSWGTALAILLARHGHEVLLFGRPSEDFLITQSNRENLHYLPGFAIPDGVRIESDEAALGDADMWVLAVPASAARSMLPKIRGESPLVVISSKGLELGSGKLLTEVCREALPAARAGVLSGPNLAVELVRGIPTVAVSAFEDAGTAEVIRSAFMSRSYRVYVTEDVVGVELAGALKNVLALGAGMSDGLGFGDNTKGALLARGLHEMTRLGLAMGARLETFMGIAGVGDLFATAVSKLSRNYRVGVAIGQGRSLTEALAEVGQTAEGVPTSEGVLMLSRRHQVPMPVFEAIETVVRGRVRPLDAVGLLMERMPKHEGLLH